MEQTAENAQRPERGALRPASRRRRDRILAATLEIIAREGTRGVRHRAVAKEAGVPLAATTYYFCTIGDLITQAFLFFAETAVSDAETLFTNCFNLVRSMRADELRNRSTRHFLVESLTAFVADYVLDSNHTRDRVILRIAFTEEALRNSELNTRRTQLEREILASIARFFDILGEPLPQADAEIILATILRLEYEVVCPDPPPTATDVRTTLRHLFNRLLAV